MPRMTQTNYRKNIGWSKTPVCVVRETWLVAVFSLSWLVPGVGNPKGCRWDLFSKPIHQEGNALRVGQAPEQDPPLPLPLVRHRSSDSGSGSAVPAAPCGSAAPVAATGADAAGDVDPAPAAGLLTSAEAGPRSGEACADGRLTGFAAPACSQVSHGLTRSCSQPLCWGQPRLAAPARTQVEVRLAQPQSGAASDVPDGTGALPREGSSVRSRSGGLPQPCRERQRRAQSRPLRRGAATPAEVACGGIACRPPPWSGAIPLLAGSRRPTRTGADSPCRRSDCGSRTRAASECCVCACACAARG